MYAGTHKFCDIQCRTGYFTFNDYCTSQLTTTSLFFVFRICRAPQSIDPARGEPSASLLFAFQPSEDCLGEGWQSPDGRRPRPASSRRTADPQRLRVRCRSLPLSVCGTLQSWHLHDHRGEVPGWYRSSRFCWWQSDYATGSDKWPICGWAAGFHCAPFSFPPCPSDLELLQRPHTPTLLQKKDGTKG